MKLADAVTVSLFGCCMTLPIFFRFAYYLNVGSLTMGVLFFLSVAIACLPVAAMSDLAERWRKHFFWIQRVCYFIYITVVILFTFMLIRDVVWTILALLFKSIPSPLNLTYVNPLNIVTMVAAVFCACYAYYEGNKVPALKKTIIYSEKIHTKKVIVLLTDLHLARDVSPDKIEKIVARTNALCPDVVLLAGDTVDDALVYIEPLLNALSRLKAKNGVYFTSGNHEFYMGYHPAVQWMENKGFHLLDGRSVRIDETFVLGGVPDIPAARRFGRVIPVRHVFNESNPESFHLLMSHTPRRFSASDPVDLVVSGHTHGGQIFPFHFFSWIYNQGFLAGLYQMDFQKQIYVSRGAGQWGPQMRFLAPSEISVIYLKPSRR